MNDSEIARVIEDTWNKTKELQEVTATTTNRYNILFGAILVIGFVIWFLGASQLFVFAFFTLSALTKIYGLAKVTRIELNMAMNNQVVVQFTVAGIAKKILGYTAGQSSIEDEI